MNEALANFLSDLWHEKPILIVLPVIGLIIFVPLVIDTYRHRKKQKRRHPRKH